MTVVPVNRSNLSRLLLILACAFSSGQTPAGADDTHAPVINPVDPKLVEQLGPDAELIIHGNNPEKLQGPGESPFATLSLVDVYGQPFSQAVRVEVARATDPVWGAQIVSPWNTKPIKKGDVLFGLIDVRAESEKESGGGQFTGWLQKPEGGWTDLRKIEGAPGPRWSRRYFACTATRDFDPGTVNFSMHLGVIPQRVEVANILLWNLGPGADLDKLPRTRLSYEGQEPDAAWRTQAQQRIDQYRKADLRVLVVDAFGAPVAGAQVEITLRRHAFGFATFVGEQVLQDTPDGRRYRDVLFKYFNRLTCPSYGAQTWGWPDPATAERYTRIIQWSVANGFQTKAHPVIWSRFDWSPQAWSQLRHDPERLRAEIDAYIVDLIGRLGRLGVEEVDMVNEPTGFHEIDDVIGDPGLRAGWFTLARDTSPTIRLGINEHTILSAGGLNTAKQDAYYAVIRDLIDRGAPLAAIGMQGHMGEDFTPPTKLWEILDRFAEFGIPLHVTEFDVNTEDELTQADYTRDFALAVFAHPAVESLTFWGFWGGDMWIPQAQLWTKEWEPRPNAQALIELLAHTLHTHEHAVTDSAGGADFRGFCGEYEVKVSRPGGATTDATIRLDKGGSSVRITLE